jgi:hypothetical protein
LRLEQCMNPSNLAQGDRFGVPRDHVLDQSRSTSRGAEEADDRRGAQTRKLTRWYKGVVGART